MSRHLLLIGLIIFANDSQTNIILHLSIYFSIVLLNDAYASFVKLSTSLIITT